MIELHDNECIRIDATFAILGTVEGMASLTGMNASRAVGMASSVPARLLGERGLGRIGAGACADIVILDRDLRVRLTMVRGVVKFRR